MFPIPEIDRKGKKSNKKSEIPKKLQKEIKRFGQFYLQSTIKIQV